MPKHFSVRNFCVRDLDQVAVLFETIQNDPDANRFHPHPFNEEYAARITNYNGQDIYLGAFEDGELIGYGMLRGWDAGYQIPSLGIYLAPRARGRGMSMVFMNSLHQHAREIGATRIRLKVYPENIRAVRLYGRMGYIFTSEEDGQLIGYFDLVTKDDTSK